MKRFLLFAVIVFALGLNFSANAQYDMARTTTDFSLPVSFAAFTATTLGDNVILKWRTESEVNNVGFSIYRSESKDGKYVKVNSKPVQGAGTDATPHDYSFTDENVVEGFTYYYYIEDVDFSGKTNRSHIIKITVGKQSIKKEQIPLKFALLQNYPNPFNPETWIPYDLANSVNVKITIYDANGSVVRTLEVGNLPAGSYISRGQSSYWDGKNDAGEKVSSGLYFYKLTAGDFSAVKRMLMIK